MPKNILKNDNERKSILNKILYILNINETNKLFSLKDIDNDIEKQNKIYQLELEIKKFFYTGHWTCFVKPTKRKWLSMIKYIFKHSNIKLLTLQSTILIDNKYTYETYYNLIF